MLLTNILLIFFWKLPNFSHLANFFSLWLTPSNTSIFSLLSNSIHTCLPGSSNSFWFNAFLKSDLLWYFKQYSLVAWSLADKVFCCPRNLLSLPARFSLKWYKVIAKLVWKKLFKKAKESEKLWKNVLRF